MRHRAFTLIELLVVIAIIAILAAILFPVFAQAKESAKITAVLSQSKQTGTAMIMYGSDNDDNFPLAMGRRPAVSGSTWANGVVTPVPEDNLPLDAIWSTPERIAMAATIWANSCYPYMKNRDILEVKGLVDDAIAGDVPKVKTRANLTMNGLMHGYSQTAIAAPSTAILLWEGAGNQNVVARAFSTPALNCGNADDCKFSPNSYASSAGVGTDIFYVTTSAMKVWTWSRHRSPMVRTDSSAKSAPIGTVIAPKFIAFGDGILSDPWAEVNTDGTAAGYWPCSFDANNNVIQNGKDYVCYFRPDRTK